MPSSPQVHVLRSGEVVARIPVSGDMQQSDIKHGAKEITRLTGQVTGLLAAEGFDFREGGWILDMGDTAFTNTIFVDGGRHRRRELAEVMAHIGPNVAVSAPGL